MIDKGAKQPMFLWGFNGIPPFKKVFIIIKCNSMADVLRMNKKNKIVIVS